jgi:hypothetical protein
MFLFDLQIGEFPLTKPPANAKLLTLANRKGKFEISKFRKMSKGFYNLSLDGTACSFNENAYLIDLKITEWREVRKRVGCSVVRNLEEMANLLYLLSADALSVN